MIYSILLCGGSGTRLWPISTDDIPKQFHKLTNLQNNDNCLIQNTIDRLPTNSTKIFASNIKYESYIQNFSNKNDIMLYEQYSKNTAPIILLSCLHILKLNPNVDPKEIKLIILPCDHVFDNDKFKIEVEGALSLVNENYIVTFGVKPTYPDSSYGYIKKTKDNKIDKFIEKPNIELAKSLINDDSYYWNSGIFICNLETLIGEYKNYAGKLYETCNDCYNKSSYINNILNIDEFYNNCPNISFDCAIMEHSKKGYVICFNGLWSDVGQWDRIYQICDKDSQGNSIINDNANITAFNSSNCYVNIDSGNIILNGVSDLIIIKNGDFIMVCDKNNIDDIKKIKESFNVKN